MRSPWSPLMKTSIAAAAISQTHVAAAAPTSEPGRAVLIPDLLNFTPAADTWLQVGHVGMKLAEIGGLAFEQDAACPRRGTLRRIYPADVESCRREGPLGFCRRSAPFEHQISDGELRGVANGVVLVGRVVHETAGSEPFDPRARRIGGFWYDDLGFSFEHHQQLFFRVTMRWMRRMARAQH